MLLTGDVAPATFRARAARGALGTGAAVASGELRRSLLAVGGKLGAVSNPFPR